MPNPYAPPKIHLSEQGTGSRQRFASLALAMFGAFLTLPELYSNASDLTQNPIGNLMGFAILVTTVISACAEWFPGGLASRLAAPALAILAVVASVVIVRFVLVFLPVLTPSWAAQYTSVVMGFIFSLSAIGYIAVTGWRQMHASALLKAGKPSGCEGEI